MHRRKMSREADMQSASQHLGFLLGICGFRIFRNLMEASGKARVLFERCCNVKLLAVYEIILIILCTTKPLLTVTAVLNFFSFCILKMEENAPERCIKIVIKVHRIFHQKSSFLFVNAFILLIYRMTNNI